MRRYTIEYNNKRYTVEANTGEEALDFVKRQPQQSYQQQDDISNILKEPEKSFTDKAKENIIEAGKGLVEPFAIAGKAGLELGKGLIKGYEIGHKFGEEIPILSIPTKVAHYVGDKSLEGLHKLGQVRDEQRNQLLDMFGASDKVKDITQTITDIPYNTALILAHGAKEIVADALNPFDLAVGYIGGKAVGAIKGTKAIASKVLQQAPEKIAKKAKLVDNIRNVFGDDVINQMPEIVRNSVTKDITEDVLKSGAKTGEFYRQNLPSMLDEVTDSLLKGVNKKETTKRILEKLKYDTKIDANLSDSSVKKIVSNVYDNVDEAVSKNIIGRLTNKKISVDDMTDSELISFYELSKKTKIPFDDLIIDREIRAGKSFMPDSPSKATIADTIKRKLQSVEERARSFLTRDEAEKFAFTKTLNEAKIQDAVSSSNKNIDELFNYLMYLSKIKKYIRKQK